MSDYIYALVLAFLPVGCMGIPIPLTNFRLLEFPVEIDRNEINSTCTSLNNVRDTAHELERRHLMFLNSHDIKDAIDINIFVHALGDGCHTRYQSLDTGQIKMELFGDINVIDNPGKLRELGGYSFTYGDVITIGGLELTLHLDKWSKGPNRKMVAIYSLADGKVIHFNYSGTDNIDTKSRGWPLDEFFGVVVGAAGKAVVP